FVDAKTDYFDSYVRSYTDLPFLVDLEDDGSGRYRPGRFVTASDLGSTVTAEADTAAARPQPAVSDKRTGRATRLHRTLGHRFAADGQGKWNLDLEDIDPALSIAEATAGDRGTIDADRTAKIRLPRFDTAAQGEIDEVTRGVPVVRIGDRVVTTVFYLMLAEYGIGRQGLPGTCAEYYEYATCPSTPARHESNPGVASPAA